MVMVEPIAMTASDGGSGQWMNHSPVGLSPCRGDR